MLVNLFTFLVGSAVVLGFLFYFNVIPPGSGANPSLPKKAEVTKKSKTAEETATLDLGSMVINLAGSGNYLKIHVVLEYPDTKELREEVEKKEPQITEAVLLTLRSKSIEDLRDGSDLTKLKNELLTAVNASLKSGKINRIYFTEFLTQ